MGKENNEGVVDIFSSDGGSAVAVEDAPREGPTPSLERAIRREHVSMPAAQELRTEATGGYSEEAHREVLDKVRQIRKERSQIELKAEEYWQKNDRAIAEAMGIAPNRAMAVIYSVAGRVGVNFYKRDALNAMRQLRSETAHIQSDIDKFQSRLEGKVEYVAPIAGQSSEEALKEKKYVREADKGFRYRLSEATDEARMLGYQYRNGLRALGQYRQEIAVIDEDIASLQANSKDPTSAAKIGNLQTRRANIVREKEALEQTQREYEQDLVVYEKSIDRFQAKISFYECIVKKGNYKIRQMESAIDILDDYIRERDDLVSVHELLNDLRALDDQHGRINDTIQRYDVIVGEQLGHITHVVQKDTDYYSTRPLMQQVRQLTKEDQVATQKDMGRILGKLNIPI